MIQLGSSLYQTDFYLCYTIEDNGAGIPPEKLHLIFLEKESDQSGENWDGCGLGLPVCEQLSKSIQARIYYTSEVGKGTQFVLVMPFNVNERTCDVGSSYAMMVAKVGRLDSTLMSNSLSTNTKNVYDKKSSLEDSNYSNSLVDKQWLIEHVLISDFRITDQIISKHTHVCNALLIAEDNINILKRYTKHLDKKKSP